MPRLYREAPAELDLGGLGQRQRLDVLRALMRQPASLEAFLAEVDEAAGAEPRLDAFTRRALRDELARPRGARGARPAHGRAHGARAPGLAAGALRRPGGGRRLLRLAAGRRGRPRVRDAPAGRRPSRDRGAPPAAFHVAMRRGGPIQLFRIFGIPVGVDVSWFVVLFLFIVVLSGAFRDTLDGSDGQAYAVAVASALLFFALAGAPRARPRAGGAPPGLQDRGDRPVLLRRRRACSAARRARRARSSRSRSPAPWSRWRWCWLCVGLGMASGRGLGVLGRRHAGHRPAGLAPRCCC